ncbi:melanocortin-2 receptor accessory protein 2 isoform X3 [Chelonoidis abingdonii]|uniref:melanocortin-2 receptor accessory protein 2 isoform X3 n=1 Tax=Chelonoidis abingdonii TaxID=106734 RepID=UPI0013F1BA65|nr:melanocortin-2 receptor accessory protein 2 isoform X3 [Chelonoidis abingdonii]
MEEPSYCLLRGLAMSAHRFISNRTSQQALSNSDYTWEYEYYEYGPVSFEGLKAHKYSIVIGFWVGLAVFVIFMFFVLTLLTKTGAPHPECCLQGNFLHTTGVPPPDKEATKEVQGEHVLRGAPILRGQKQEHRAWREKNLEQTEMLKSLIMLKAEHVCSPCTAANTELLSMPSPNSSHTFLATSQNFSVPCWLPHFRQLPK